MAYGVEHDRLRAILPGGFSSLRPVLRINAEIRDGKTAYVEFNTAVEKDGIKGWINIGFKDDILFYKNEKTTVFETEHLKISFTRVGVMGSCPAEKDNSGCYFINNIIELRPPEIITSEKEFCDCRFKWDFGGKGTCGESVGATLPAIPMPVKNIYPKENFSVENAAVIPCNQVLGTYAVEFERK